MIDTVIFDKDGTMFDTETLFYKYYEETFRQYGYSYSMDIHKKVTGTSIDNVYKVFCRELGITPGDPIVGEIKKEIDKKMVSEIDKNGIPIKPGLKEIISYLKDNEYKMAVASSSPKDNVLHNLKAAGYSDVFNAVVCGEDISKSKPEPDIFLKAAQLVNSSPETCLVIEDSAAGINGAKNAKMKCICIPDMFVPEKEDLDKADAVLKSLDKVIEYLEAERIEA